MSKEKSPTFIGVRVDSKAGPRVQLESPLFGKTDSRKHTPTGGVKNESKPFFLVVLGAKLLEVAKRWFGPVEEGRSKEHVNSKPDQGNVESNSGVNTKVIDQKMKHKDGSPPGLVEDSTIALVGDKGDKQR